MAGKDLMLRGRFDYKPILVGFNSIIPKAHEFQQALAAIEAAERRVANTQQSVLVGAGEMALVEGATANAILQKSKAHAAATRVIVGGEKQQQTETAKTAQAEKQATAAKEVGARESARIFAGLEAQYKRDQRALTLSEAAKRAEIDLTAAKFRQAAAAAAQAKAQPVFIGNRESLAGFIGPQRPLANQSSIAAPPKSSITPQMMADYAAFQDAERERTRTMAAEAAKRVGIKAQETYTLSAHDKLLLQEERRTYQARASAENDLFQRQRQATRAQTLYRLKLYADDAAMVEQIKKTHLTKMRALDEREAGFSKTPFQTMLRQQGAMVGFFSKMGLSAGQAGQAVQLAGYQVGDFAVQVGSGQSAMRAFLQQAPQFLQIFGKWGVGAGVAVSVLGALWMVLKKNKDEAKGLESTEMPEWLRNPAKFNETVEAFRALSAAQADFARQKAAPQLITNEHGQQVLNYVDALNRATVSEKAFKDATGQSTAEFKQKIGAFISMEQLLAASQAKIYGPQIDALEDFQRAQIEAMADGVQKRLDMEALGFQKAQRQEEIRYAEALLAAKGNFVAMAQAQANFTVVSNTLAQTNAQKQANIRAEHAKKARDEAARRREEEVRELEAALRAWEKAEGDRASFTRQQAADIDRLNVRMAEARAIGNEQELLQIRQQSEIKQAEEKYNLDMTEAQYAAHLAYMKGLQETHAVESQNLAAATAKKNAEKLIQANQSAAQSYMALAGIAAETWDVGLLQKTLMWLNRIEKTMSTIAAIQLAAKSGSSFFGVLKALFGVAAFAAAPATGGASLAGGAAVGTVLGASGPTGSFLPKTGAGYSMPPATIPPSTYAAPKSSAQPVSITFGATTVQITGSVTAKEAREIGRQVGEGQAEAISSRLGAFSDLEMQQNRARRADYLGVTG